MDPKAIVIDAWMTRVERTRSQDEMHRSRRLLKRETHVKERPKGTPKTTSRTSLMACGLFPCSNFSASRRRSSIPLLQRMTPPTALREISRSGVPKRELVSGRFPFRRSQATRSSAVLPSLFTSARLQVPQPEDLRTRAVPKSLADRISPAGGIVH